MADPLANQCTDARLAKVHLAFNALLLAFVVICMWRDASGEGRLHEPDLFIATVLLICAYAIVPFDFFLNDRFMPLIYFGLLLWVGTAKLSRVLRCWFTTASNARLSWVRIWACPDSGNTSIIRSMV